MLLFHKQLFLVFFLTTALSAQTADESDEYDYYEDDQDVTVELTFDLSKCNIIVSILIDVQIQNGIYYFDKLDELSDSNLTNSTNEPEELLNQDIADTFKTWLDSKSNELHELNMNFSGYNLLNETYNVNLRKHAEFKWINFTEMILNISETISEVLYNKTLLVEQLSEHVEKAYDAYQNDTEQIQDSLDFVYYDAKSPKTFCDVEENWKDQGSGER